MSCFARHPRSSTALLFTVGVIAVSTPTEARACSPDVCASSSRFDAIELRHDVVGDRSVLVFDARQGSRRTLDDLSAIQIAVTDGTAAKDGAVETIDGFDTVSRGAPQRH